MSAGTRLGTAAPFLDHRRPRLEAAIAPRASRATWVAAARQIGVPRRDRCLRGPVMTTVCWLMLSSCSSRNREGRPELQSGGCVRGEGDRGVEHESADEACGRWHATAVGRFLSRRPVRYFSARSARRVRPWPGAVGSGRARRRSGRGCRRRTSSRCGRGRGTTPGGAGSGSAAATWACRCGRAVPGDLQAVGGGDGGGAQPVGDAAAAGGVGLQAVHGAGCAHAAEVGEVVAVLAGGDVGVRRRRGPGAGRRGRRRRPAPRTSARRRSSSGRASPGPPACACSRRWRRRRARRRRRSTVAGLRDPVAGRGRCAVPHDSPILIFTRGMPLLLGPAGELVGRSWCVVVGGEAAAAVDRHRRRGRRRAGGAGAGRAAGP